MVKVVSYAHGAKRATASAHYIERDEVELETHAGQRLPDKAAVADEMKAWSSSFDKRAPSQDVVTVRLQLSGLRDCAEDHERLAAAAGAAFEGHRHAVRSFLHQQFADHKFMFGVHTDKAEAGHIHAHAIVAVRSEGGTKLHPGPSDLAQWRANYAGHAREHGLQVVATRAAEQASSRSYGPKDKSIVDVAANPRPQRTEQDRAYASNPRNAKLIRNAQARMAIARANPVRIPITERERAGLRESLEHWSGLAKADPTNETARTMAERLFVAKEAGDALNTLKTALSQKSAISTDPSPINKVRAPKMTENAERSADASLPDEPADCRGHIHAP